MLVVPRLACGLLFVIIVLFLLRCSKTNEVSNENVSDSVSDKKHSDTGTMTLKDMKNVLKEAGFPYGDSVTDAHFAFFCDKDLTIRMRLTLPSFSGSNHEEWRLARTVECGSFPDYHFNVPEIYSLAWWDPLPRRESDVCMKWRIEEPRGDVLAIRRSDAGRRAYYVVFRSMTRDVDPSIVSLMRTGAPVKRRDNTMPSRFEAYEFRYSSE